MTAYSVRTIDDAGGTLELRDGRQFAFVPRQTWSQLRLDQLSALVQAQIDHVMPVADLAADDPDKAWAAGTPITNANGQESTVELIARYGNQVFLEGTNIRFRSTRITFTHDGDRLIPRSEVVR